MHRDPDLIRELLLAFEKKDDLKIVEATSLVGDNHDVKTVEYHLMLMAQAGLIDYEAFKSKSNPERLIRVMPFNLTWKGHEYLDAVRDQGVWQKSIKATKGKTGDFILKLRLPLRGSRSKQPRKKRLG